MPEEPSWREFAYLAAVPVGQTINDSDNALSPGEISRLYKLE